MLISLHIKNYALIESLTVDFDKGLNIITGETGAGKSIIIGALGLILGERASAEVIRKGEIKTIVEAEFDCNQNQNLTRLLSKYDLDLNEKLIVRREVSSKGSNRCFINDTPVSLQIVKDFGNYLVDLHGQHDHQSLLFKENHIHIVDELGKYSSLIAEFNSQIEEQKKTLKKIDELKSKKKSIKEKIELYSFQLKEIETISPSKGEDQILENELRILENSENLLSLCNSLYLDIYEGEDTVHNRVSQVARVLSELSSIDDYFNSSNEDIENVSAIISELAENVRKYKDLIELDPTKIENVRERYSSINLLKKKYGGSLDSVLEFQNKIKNEISFAENFDEEITNLLKSVQLLRIEAGKIAKQISQERKKLAKSLKKLIENELVSLGIVDSIFEISMNWKKAENNSDILVLIEQEAYSIIDDGIDDLEFLISTNKGEDPKPLAKVASGGEISRIMLALKTVLAKSEKLPLLVFDEIDTGISGRFAQKVGIALKSLAGFHQIIAITHLPQIAALADQNYSVSKSFNGDRVVSSIKRLEEKDKLNEIAKLISGENITPASLSGAEELMNIK